MSNRRKLRQPLNGQQVLYSCAVCALKFHSWADREAHWRNVKGARLCQDRDTMVRVLGFTYRRGAWAVTGTRRAQSQSVSWGGG